MRQKGMNNNIIDYTKNIYLSYGNLLDTRKNAFRFPSIFVT